MCYFTGECVFVCLMFYNGYIIINDVIYCFCYLLKNIFDTIVFIIKYEMFYVLSCNDSIYRPI